MLESQKRANQKWQDNNPEKYNEILKRCKKSYYERNKVQITEKKRQYYQQNKERLNKGRVELERTRKKEQFEVHLAENSALP
jgi:ABC-type nitrate/sulfonate/bicarbonate transport system substrate-binding protein